MATASSNPSSITSAGVWLTTTNVYSSNNTYATDTGATQNTEYPFDVSGFNFSAIPAGSTITSTTVTIEAKTGTANRAQVRAELYDGSTLLTGSLALTNLTAADANYTFTPTATLAQLQSASLKVRVINKRIVSQASTTSVDYVKIDVVYTPPQPSLTQAAYRFYSDGTESGSTALGTQDTAYSVNVDSDANLLLRVRLQNTSGNAVQSTDDFQLQYEKNASGTWVDIVSLLTEIQTLADSTDPINYNTTKAIGQSFHGNGKVLRKASFWMYRVGNPTGDVTASIYSHTGTFGTSSNALAWIYDSVYKLGSTVPTSAGWVDFTFDGTFTIANGTDYCVALVPQVATDTSNYYMAHDTSSGAHPGNETVWTSAWNASTGWDVAFRLYSGTASNVTVFDSTNLTDGGATTNRLGSGTGTFAAGKISEDGLVDDLGWAANNYSELLYSLTLLSADLANGDTLRFRVLYNGAVTQMTYTLYPTLNLTKTGGATTGYPKAWTGAWNKKPAKVWNGASWAIKPVKAWTGSVWKTLS